MVEPNKNAAYFVYCDEAGDPGLTSKSTTDWFVVSAVVVAAKREQELPRWIAEIKEPMRGQQRSDLHFYLLSDAMKRRASQHVGQLPLRCFTVISHKGNMHGHRNILCEERYAWRLYGDDGTYVTVPRKTWFHNFVLKVLLERVSDWCLRRSLREYGAARPIDITIGRKGGFQLPDFLTTLEIDRRHYNAKKGVLRKYLSWPVINLDMIRTEQAAKLAGLQLADVVCGSFWNAVEEQKFGSGLHEYALNLKSRMPIDPTRNRRAYHSLTALPWRLHDANLSPDQQRLLTQFGYSKRLVRPGPRSNGR